MHYQYPSFLSLCFDSLCAWTASGIHWLFLALVLFLGAILDQLNRPNFSWVLAALERVVLAVT